MRNLAVNEIANVAGGAIGDVDYFEFALFPGEKMVGVQLTVIGYDKDVWFEHGLFWDTKHEVLTPIYDVQPILSYF